jgi:hypothetical protein
MRLGYNFDAERDGFLNGIRGGALRQILSRKVYRHFQGVLAQLCVVLLNYCAQTFPWLLGLQRNMGAGEDWLDGASFWDPYNPISWYRNAEYGRLGIIRTPDDPPFSRIKSFLDADTLPHQNSTGRWRCIAADQADCC